MDAEDQELIDRAEELLQHLEDERQRTGEIDTMGHLAWINTFGWGLIRLAQLAPPTPPPPPTSFLCNGDYWYKSGCGNQVAVEGCYCDDCSKILDDNNNRWPGRGRR